MTVSERRQPNCSRALMSKYLHNKQTRVDTEIASKESCIKLCMEIINLTLYLNQKWTSGTEDSNTQLCNISEQSEWTTATFLSQQDTSVFTSTAAGKVLLFNCGIIRQDRKSTNVLELAFLFCVFF